LDWRTPQIRRLRSPFIGKKKLLMGDKRKKKGGKKKLVPKTQNSCKRSGPIFSAVDVLVAVFVVHGRQDAFR
jgi:hypothetical protein